MILIIAKNRFKLEITNLKENYLYFLLFIWSKQLPTVNGFKDNLRAVNCMTHTVYSTV